MNTEGLVGHDLFQLLRPDQVQIISDVAERISLADGETVFAQGEEAVHFYVVLEGQVALRLPGRTGVNILIEEAGRGAVFGSCLCFQRRSYTLTARCIQDSNLLKIKASTLKDILEEDPVLGHTVQALISRVYFQRYIDTMLKLQSIVGNIPLQVE